MISWASAFGSRGRFVDRSGIPQYRHSGGGAVKGRKFQTDPLPNGEYKLTVLEQASSQGSKTGGGLGFALTGGIKKMKTKTVIPGQHASIRTSEAQPVFYFYFEDKAAGLGKFGTATVSNPNQFALVKLDVTKSSRETIIGESGLSGMNTGAAEKSMVTFKSERLRSGLYKVAANGPMEPGEYCFLASQGSQIFDFAVTPNQ